MKSMILAVDSEGGIGKEGGIPWHLPEDLRWFRLITMGHGRCIMGRKTWESLPKPLDGRINTVVTSNPYAFIRAPDEVYTEPPVLEDGDIVIGGASLYEHYINEVDVIFVTHVDGDYDCDVNVSDILKYHLPIIANIMGRILLSDNAAVYIWTTFMTSSQQRDLIRDFVGYWAGREGWSDVTFVGIDEDCDEAYTNPDDVSDIIDTPIVNESTVDNPQHYTQAKIETIDAIASITHGHTGEDAFCAGNVVKYISRAPFKGSKNEDLQKALWYLKRLIENGGDDDC